MEAKNTVLKMKNSLEEPNSSMEMQERIRNFEKDQQKLSNQKNRVKKKKEIDEKSLGDLWDKFHRFNICNGTGPPEVKEKD